MINTKNQQQMTAIQAAQNWLEKKPIYIDTETTGLDKNAEIIEISIVDFDGKILFESMFKPTRPIPKEATDINHITNEMVQNKPAWAVLWLQIRSHLFGRTIGMYNAEFDHRMMKQTHQKYKLPWKEDLQVFDIMKLYAQFRGEYDPIRQRTKYFSLETAGKLSNIAIPNSHRASDDTLLARALLHYIANASSA